jgi:hypothetical protein
MDLYERKGMGMTENIYRQRIEALRGLMKENGITYLVVLAPDNIDSAFPYEGIPTSFFVDQNGVIRGKTITGAYPNLYESGLEQALEAAQ